jgi:hypothetical protein
MSVLPVFFGWTAMAGPDGRAVVKSDSSPVYSKMSTASEVVKTLKRGDAVVVEISISGYDGEWCRIREESRTTGLGYIRCGLLDREQPINPAIVIPQSPQQAAPAAPSTAGGDESIVVSTYMRNAWNFAEVLDFSVNQRERLPELAERTGVNQCIQEMEAAYRRHGLPTTKGAADKLTEDDIKRLQPNQIAMAREVMPSHRRCNLSELRLSEQVLDLATPEQRERHAYEIKKFRDVLTIKRAAILAGR